MPERVPWAVPDDEPAPAFVPELDTDLDGRPDTLVTDDGSDLLVLTDLDGDGLADQVLRIGADGVVRAEPGPGAEVLDGALGDPSDPALGGALGGAHAGLDPGSAG